MANYLSLEEAAKKLGIPTDRLVGLRSQGQIRGFKDGASWKFPEDEIERLKDELPDMLGDSDIIGGSGELITEGSSGSLLSLGSSDNIIGGDGASTDESSDLEIGGESLDPGGSDVNLIPNLGDESDVAIIASDSDLLLESAGSGMLEIDSQDLRMDDPAMADSAQLDLAIEPNAGSTGPVTDKQLDEISQSHPDVLPPVAADSGDDSDLSLMELVEEDSGDEMIGADDSSMGLGVSDLDLKSGGASSLELMGDLDDQAGSSDPVGMASSRGADVLSELDLLSAEQGGSGLISGDSENLLVSSGLGSSIGAENLADSDLADIDDALADDDDLIIADDDDDLVISNAGSDISVAGDSGINLMSPSDSGLSLESEPLDLAGSSISALDLGAELAEGGSGIGSDIGDGSVVDFQADEEFQLSPSGVGLDADIESGSQVIEIEDSEDAIGEAVEFDDAGFADADPLGGDVFADSPAEAFDTDTDDAFAVDDEQAVMVDDDEDAVAIDESMPAPVGSISMGGYEVPFTLFQCLTLMSILCVMAVGGMLMTDLIRNMWTYTETATPVSSLTDSLIGLMGWGP